MDPIYKSDLNRGVPLARPGEFRPLRIATLPVEPPVVLAPMAGVTNYPFRSICREFGAGLYVTEMITARGILVGNRKTLLLSQFGPDETPRSIQLYGTRPEDLGEAARVVVGEGKVDHIDINFGCPVRKVTAHGGGAAIPLKTKLMAALVRAAVRGAGPVPVTIKFRMGIDNAHLTYRSSGDIAEAEGCAAVALHARTAAQLYDGEARWDAIADLKSRVTSIPVLGNGDVWEALDALRMMRSTGCDGVVVGRGCLGRPWLFRDLADVFAGREPADPPRLGEIVAIALRHARALVLHFGEASGIQQFRKWGAWYTKAFPASAALRDRLMRVERTSDVESILEALDADVPFPPAGMRAKRGKHSGTQVVSLPPGYLDRLDDAEPPSSCVDDLVAAEGG